MIARDGATAPNRNVPALDRILAEVASGAMTAEAGRAAIALLLEPGFEFANPDHDRERRCGFSEVVFGAGKTRSEIVAIVRALSATAQNVLVTRVAAEDAIAVRSEIPELMWNERARTLLLKRDASIRGVGEILIVSAGTADLPVAEEAAVTLEAMGHRHARIYDVGVAGIHRVLSRAAEFREAAAVIVVAGMEGALPSVVGGLTDRPVIAVPTSTGYGASLHGLAALLAMLNSCAAGVCVVNIDNGFGAAYAAARINGRALPIGSPADEAGA